MIYVLTCKDKPGHQDIRPKTRPAHLEYLNRLNEEGRLKFAGPFLDDAGQPVGSMIAVEADDKPAAESIAAGDPYSKAGLFESVEARAWNWTFNNPETA
jgi:uncharacterized protein